MGKQGSGLAEIKERNEVREAGAERFNTCLLCPISRP